MRVLECVEFLKNMIPPKKWHILIKIIKTLLIDVLITNVDDFPGFIPWPAFLGGPRKPLFTTTRPWGIHPNPGDDVGHRVAVRKGDQGATGWWPGTASCIQLYRSQMQSMFSGWFFPMFLLGEWNLLNFLDCQELSWLIFHGTFAPRYPPKGDHGSGWSQLHLDYEDGQGGSPLGKVTLESETDRNDGPIHHLNYCCTPFMT